METTAPSVKINFTGDLAFWPLDFAERKKRFNINDYASVKDADLLVGNFEFPLSKEKNGHFVDSDPDHLAPDDCLELLDQFDFDILSVANNHILDWGAEGIAYTRGNLEDMGAKTLGAGPNEAEARKPLIVEKGGITFGFMGASKKGNQAGESTPGSAMIDPEVMVPQIQELQKKVDHVILILHWGVEFSDYPYPTDREYAQALIEAGASCIIGHHPHVIQGMELINDRPVFYSLGSFIYDAYAEKIFVKDKIEERMTSFIASLEFTKDKVVKWDVLPFKNEPHHLFPKAIEEPAKRDEFFAHYDTISSRIPESAKYFYGAAISNLAKRQAITIWKKLVKSRGLFLFKLIRNFKFRHLKILFGPIIAKFKR